MGKIYLLAAACLLHALSYSQNIIQLGWDFNGNAGNELSVSATTNNANLESAVISRGAGLSVVSLTNSFSAGSWTTTNSLADAIANNDYLQFSVKPKSSFITSLSLLETVFRRSSTGPDHFQWQYSKDGNTFLNINSQIIYTSTVTNGMAQLPIDLNGIPDLQNVPSSTEITIRLYGYNASSAGGTFSIGRLTGNDLAVTGTTQSITPVKLLHFEARMQGEYTVLQWRTAGEKNNYKYEVERSADGIPYRKIGEIISGNSIVGSAYNFNDKNPGISKNYYRLRMIDFDGHTEFSKVVMVNRKELSVVGVYPNPANRNIFIHYPEIPEVSMLYLVGTDGKTYGRYQLPARSSKICLIIDHLADGNYILTLVGNTGILSTRWSKQ